MKLIALSQPDKFCRSLVIITKKMINLKYLVDSIFNLKIVKFKHLINPDKKILTMKTQTLNDAITFALGTDNCKRYLAQYEKLPKEFEIYELRAKLLNPEMNTVRLLINLRDIYNSQTEEDVVIDIKVKGAHDFEIIRVGNVHYAP